ncbi:MAG: bifunctional YncE family protein/alkaline phosphatase family protein [Bryobacterales bacterium]|nr:bifunctional YncE family protein/alkaline phosphatase family protein [Bryobacterales bacterium]
MKRIAFLLMMIGAGLLVSQPGPREQVGPLPGGGFLVPTGWRVLPAGTQIPVDTFPMASTLSRDGKHLVVLNGGYQPPSLSVIDLAAGRETSRTPVPDGWLGLALSPKGDRLYVGGGSHASVFEFTFANGALQPARVFPVVPEGKRTKDDFIGDVALSPDGRLIYASDLYRDSVVVINPQSGMLIERIRTGRRPYRIVFHPDGRSFFVTSWTDGTLGHYDAGTGERLGVERIGAHATDMIWVDGKQDLTEGQAPVVARLFITASNTNNAYSIGVTESKALRRLESINLALTPRQPLGMTPSAVSLGPDGKTLYVVCSDANAVAVADISEERSRVRGFIPSGWYPTAVRALPDGRVAILNGRGLRSFPNPNGPNPQVRPAPTHQGLRSDEYVGRLQTGSVSIVPALTEASLFEYTDTVFANAPYRDQLLDDAGIGLDNPVPTRPGDPSPIEHVLYVVKENRTYDQVLGAMKQGNGDPNLVLFGEDVTPNQHKLAREFVLFDNFYVTADVSADGHNWSTAAIASDYVQRLWPNSYGGRRRFYDYEGTEPTAAPPAGYLWTNAAAAGVSMRNYGYWVNNRPPSEVRDGVQIASVRDPVLNRVTNRAYRGYDLDYPDVERAKVLLKDLEEFERTGTMPRLILIRLGNDHTHGTTPGKLTPKALVADNDHAVGMIVEGISKSRFWPKTAVFILEDDAQNGADHVDSHRSIAFVASPYARRRAVDSSFYTTTSMLRTMELILGLQPMTHFDASARPMAAAFQAKPDLTPFTAEAPRVSVTELNPQQSATSARSLAMDFSEEDRIDDDELNEILWRAIRGGDPPPPVRSFFAR